MLKCRLKYEKGFSRQINGKEILAREITGSSSQRWKMQNFDYRVGVASEQCTWGGG